VYCRRRCRSPVQAARASRTPTCTSAVYRALWLSSNWSRSFRRAARSSALASSTTTRLVRSCRLCNTVSFLLIRSVCLFSFYDKCQGRFEANVFRSRPIPSYFIWADWVAWTSQSFHLNYINLEWGWLTYDLYPRPSPYNCSWLKGKKNRWLK